MRYLLDTVAVIRHLSGQWKIGNAAATILDNIGKQDDCLLVSVVSLMEIMYLAEKKRIPIDLQETLRRIESSSKYMIVNLTPEILRVAQTVNFYELHDRLILATAKWLDVPLISSDSKFAAVTGIRTIWD
ncbi:PIN domain protein [Candidatus Moduliflexus flocculans]|uniref:PIN domain protein n=1 Tax=Candidatus Moduliflexus flocculans TaxID=1499966 RepID=A0A0S6W0H4_9BACT|nr:PIN domain protein [Candidatus Moduliflexus flocculans]